MDIALTVEEPLYRRGPEQPTTPARARVCQAPRLDTAVTGCVPCYAPPPSLPLSAGAFSGSAFMVVTSFQRRQGNEGIHAQFHSRRTRHHGC